MSELGDLLKELRGKESLRDVAKRAGVSHTYLSIVEKGYDLRSGSPAKPSFDTLRRLAKAYNYPYEKLLKVAGYLDDQEIREEQSQYKTPSNIEPIDPDDWTKIPIVGSIAAGEPITRIEHIEGYQYIPKKVIKNREAFALRVKGDSMSGDGIRDGHIVACIKTPEVTPNDVAVVAVGDDEATLKRVQQEGDICILIPSNPDMRPYTVKTSEVYIIGKAVMYTGYLD